MRIDVAPRSLWLAYDVPQPERLAALLPKHLDLASVKLLGPDVERKPKLLFNAFDVSSQWMNGHRVEVQTVAIHPIRRTFHLVVLDCLSDTLMWTPTQGIMLANARCTRPASSRDDFTLSVRGRRRGLEVRGTEGGRVPIRERFAIEANRVCYYGSCDMRFPMTFNASSIARPVRTLSLTHLRNSLWKAYREEDPTHAFYHPHGMTFDVEVPSSW